MSTELLRTKLFIPRPRPVAQRVPRPRLVERLNAGLGCKLTLISAPAGFGKTTLLSEWVSSSDPRGRVAWISLDKGDNDPTRFWSYVIAALQTVHPGLGGPALAMLQSPHPPSIESVLTGLINEIATARTDWVALVLDDLHTITNPQINDALGSLLGNLPAQSGPGEQGQGIHLTASGRADPPWALARLRARGELNELRADDLRFTYQEAAAFLNVAMKLSLSPDDVAVLEERTEGWVVGLQMAALSMQGRQDVSGLVKAFTGSHRFILDYLVEEVLDQLPPTIQEFLIKTSVLESLSASLCDAVADRDDSQTVLAQLDRANLFLVPLDDERRWYRYHHLFADLLRNRLEQALAEEVPALHRRASAWYEDERLIAKAIDHAFATNDMERAARLVERGAIEAIFQCEHSTLLRWLETLPVQAIHTRPWLCVYLAWSRYWIGPRDQVGHWLQAAERALAIAPSPNALGITKAERRQIAGNICALRAHQAHHDEDLPRVLRMAQHAIELLPEGDSICGSSMLVLGEAHWGLGDLKSAARALSETKQIALNVGNLSLAVVATCRLAHKSVKQSRLHKAFETCQEALRLATHPSGRQLLSAGHAKVRMSQLLYEWSNLTKASSHLGEGMEECAQWGPVDAVVESHVSLVRLQLAQGNTGSALDTLKQAEQRAQGQSLDPWISTWLDDCRVRLWLATGRLDAAIQWSASDGPRFDGPLSYHRDLDHVNLARVLCAQGAQDPSGPYLTQALDLLDRLLQAAELAGWTHDAIKISVLKALALHAHGDTEKALFALRNALSLAEPGGYVRTFVDEGAPMAQLLSRILAQPRDLSGKARPEGQPAARRSIAADYVPKLLTVLAAEITPEAATPQPHPAPLIESLTERELEVLQLLSTTLSTAEIANELYIAVSTLRTHTKSIYGKLDVHSRREAIARAQALQLL